MDELLTSLRWLSLAVLAALLVILTGCLAPGEQSTPVKAPRGATVSPTNLMATPAADLPVAPVMGARAPDFTLTDLNGDKVSLSDLRGQAVLLNFWTTW